ncbi:MAG: hypothetical protein AB1714_07040 [Acidobacteriota bacterium]
MQARTTHSRDLYRSLVNQLRDAMARIKKLDGMLPICAGCKKIRNDKGYWQQVESYITQHTDATFSHSLCDEWIKKFYPDPIDQDTD